MSRTKKLKSFSKVTWVSDGDLVFDLEKKCTNAIVDTFMLLFSNVGPLIQYYYTPYY